MKRDPMESVLARCIVDSETGCWLSTHHRNGGGYAMSWNGSGMQLTHRLVWERLVGPIPEGLQLDHLCRVRRCFNPDHLEVVTQLENVRRGRGSYLGERTHCANGHPFGDAMRADGAGRYCRTCCRDKMRRRRAAS